MSKLKEKLLKFFQYVRGEADKLNLGKNIQQIINWKYFKQAITFIVLFIFFIGFVYGHITASKSIVIKDIDIALRKSNVRKLYKEVKLSNSDKKLKKSELEPLIKFFNKDKNRITNLVTSLKNNEKLTGLSLEKKNGVFGNKYCLNIDLMNLNIKTNLPGSVVYIDGIKKGIVNENGELDIKDLVPGIYNVKVEKKSKYSTVLKNEEIVLTQNKTSNIYLDAINVTLISNFPNGEVYINNNPSGLKVREFKNIGPFKTDGSYKVSILADTPWGKISTEDVKIEDYPEIRIDVNFRNSNLNNEIENIMNEFYTSVFEALNSENKNDIKECTDNVRDDIYEILKKKYFLLKNKYSIEDLQIKLENSEITLDNDTYKGNIVVNVAYKVNKKILGIELKSRKFSDNFFTKIKYENGRWKVYDVENFSLNENIENY